MNDRHPLRLEPTGQHERLERLSPRRLIRVLPKHLENIRRHNKAKRSLHY